MIELSHLHCRFGSFRLRDVSLRIGRGEYWVILGPSGCGKSVLLQTIAGFFTPEQGQILVGERDLRSTPPERRNMGMVFQQSALFPHRSVRGNIAYGLVARRIPRDEVKREQSMTWSSALACRRSWIVPLPRSAAARLSGLLLHVP
jgi:ABC-type Fe3+/spermidine/putrescine transport system ATPase subunit